VRERAPAQTCTGTFEGGSRLCDACRRQDGAAIKACTRLVAESLTMRELVRRAVPIAASNAPVVIQGETGTGKEVLARTLHASSPRAGRPFVAVNCGAIPGDLIETELFGHARGAFSGAVADRPGLFEAADGGTLLLDEIAEIPLSLQCKLLRVLQEGEVRRVGTNHAIRVDVRVLAATHRDITSLVRAGAFREDLYYRLKVFSLRLPPLRDRPEDILPLGLEILVHLPGLATRFSPEAREALLAYPWPGNVRELVNAMRHAAALARGECVEIEDLPEEVAAPTSTRSLLPGPRANGSGRTLRPPSILEPLAVVERRHILAVVDACRGNQAEAARVLGIARNTLWRKLEAYHRSDDGTAPEPDEC
jgi:DNA-binding NtrC family response regulator